jgi:hypothetical protein
MKWSFDLRSVADEGWPSSEVWVVAGRAASRGCLPSEGIVSRNARLETCALGLDAAFWFDAFHQRTLEWLSLPVLAVPFWGRPLWLPRAPTRKAASIENHQVP